MNIRSFARWALVTAACGLLAAAAGCTTVSDGCDCAEGFVCCEATGSCARNHDQCAGAAGDDDQGGDAPPGDADAPANGPIDILLVIDNSSETAPLRPHVELTVQELVTRLTAADVDYRIGMVSTDAAGFTSDCCGEALFEPGNRGACDSCDCAGHCSTCVPCEPRVVVRRPHDGALGRLIAAHDPQAYDIALHDDLDPVVQTVLANLFPADVLGVPWVIDSASLSREACASCGCPDCVVGACAEDCAVPVAQAMAVAHARSNLAGLGRDGFGWEQGLLSGLLAIGIDPAAASDAAALDPGSGLLAPGGANRFTVDDGSGPPEEQPWLRPEARLALLFFSNEDDCSMPEALFSMRHLFETSQGEPLGSVCYQPDARAQLHEVARMARLVDDAIAREVRVGYVGSTLHDADGACWAAADCATATPAAEPISDCACFAPSTDLGWCAYTANDDTTGALPGCDGLAGERYVEFAGAFAARAFSCSCGVVKATLADLATGTTASSPICE